MLKRNVTLLNFQDARNASEKIRYSSEKKKKLSNLSLSENENKALKEFISMPIEIYLLRIKSTFKNCLFSIAYMSILIKDLIYPNLFYYFL